MFSKFKWLFPLATLSILISCKNSGTDSEIGADLPAPTPIHISFAGGGWRAHTGHAGWTIGLLKDGERTLGTAFNNVATISSNSGGSWFSSMLLYSDVFNTQIQAKGAYSNWGESGGWLGNQISLFNAVDNCLLDSTLEYTYCVLTHYAGGLHWRNAVDNLVFNGYSLGSTTLQGTRMGWAKNKTLLMQTSLMTSNALLNAVPGSETGDKAYYQACYFPSMPDPQGYSRSSCDPEILAIASPVTFSSIPPGLGLKQPLFLPQIGDSGIYNLAYTENALIDPSVHNATLQNGFDTSNVPVMSAAAASSAAVGFLGSDNWLSDWELAYKLRDLSVSFSLENSTVADIDLDGIALEKLASSKAVRLADGGTVDNSGVAQLVAHLQRNNLDSDFTIVAFDNVTEKYPTGSNTVEAGMDIAHLFGYGICDGPSFCVGDNCGSPCYDTVSPQVFTEASFQNAPVVWEYKDADPNFEHKLIYTKYKVTTVVNDAFGVQAGSTGTVHAFSCIYGDAGTEPTSSPSKGGFDAYLAMLRFINDGISKNGGLKHLEEAFNISGK